MQSLTALLALAVLAANGPQAATAQTAFMPDLWIEPLGALVKTGPAIVLMLVALLTLDNRWRFQAKHALGLDPWVETGSRSN